MATKLERLEIYDKGTYFETRNYSIFKFLNGNRDVEMHHLKRLIESMSEIYLLSIIVVNEHFEIIDGQHRFSAAKQLNLPVFFIIKNGYGLNEVQRLNTNSSVWNKKDYLESFCEVGKKPYLQFKKFMEDFPDFKTIMSLDILTNSTGKEGRTNMKKFESGKLEIPNLAKSYDNANLLLLVKPFCKLDGNLVKTFLVLFQNKNYNHDEFLRKLKKQPTTLQPCKKIEQYKLLIEDIYNTGRRDKVNLRY